ncbi:Eukaryotic translation initiation factor 3 subunit K [Penicillium atrosanguineum]|uniref:Conserved oligomeric Golgi complex subunit 5 n=1 Tax=Penicillium atrosanguineum TaxID=1132637 RepID=UPI0023A49143|nr:Conserved oligomeric Golgi complex subunit 5 [Penicillium atrosanguineum]KAJ5132682.1 Eukaryotic translation initiation factor 3 subunit K [Penicillium atrosanguineum]KAJ5141432.1 Eukaryotic translation initiation factor 3 subunit K [Penicillium atrosanguineum]KAJ5290348.1 Conserved oligomeric Golgi complex subunit 5 [Penicillium atrosanguineum]
MVAFDKCETRPPHIDVILNGLDRYNPETTTVFQDYVAQQCEDRTFDCYANLALLKLYQFNPHLLQADTVTNVLTKALTVFPSPAFSLCLALLPAHSQPFPKANAQAVSQNNDFVESVQKLSQLSTLLESAQYTQFWSTLNSDDLYADLTADVAGFEELIRIRIAIEVGKAFRTVSAETLEAWLDVRSRDALEKFVADVCGWKVENGVVCVPTNKENEARSEVKSERVGVDMFGRVIRRGFELPL